jgi:hypothetical protein
VPCTPRHPRLTTLVGYLREHHRLVVSVETVRRVLRQAGITWQRTKTCKTSRDPDFAAKMARVLDLYDHPPVEGRVLRVAALLLVRPCVHERRP